MCAYNKLNGTYASEHRWLLTRRPARRVGLRRAGRVRLGRGPRPGGRARGGPGPGDAAEPRRQRRGDRRRGARAASSTRRCSTRRSRACLQLVERVRATRPGRRRLPASTPTRTTRWRAPRRRSARCCSRTTTRCCRCSRRAGETIAVIGEFARTPALPGRRQLAGQPDAGRRRARRAARRGAGRRRGRLRRRLRDRHAPTTTRRWPTRRSRSPAEPSTVVVFLGLPAADESEGYDRTHIDLPANQTALLRAPRPTANPRRRRRARQRLGGGRLSGPGSSTPRAVLECWLSGQAAGGAVADLLLGDRQPVRAAGRDAPDPPGGQPVVSQLPRRGRARALRRGRVRRLPRLRRARPRRQLPVRPRPLLHPLRLRRPRRRACPREDGGARRRRQLPRHQHRAAPRQGGRPALRRRSRGRRRPAAARAQGLRQGRRSTPARARPSTFRLDARDLSYWSTAPRLGARGRRVHARRRRLLARPAPHDHDRRRRAAAARPARRHGHPPGMARRSRPAPRCCTRRSAPTRPAGRAASSASPSCLARHRQLPDQHASPRSPASASTTGSWTRRSSECAQPRVERT